MLDGYPKFRSDLLVRPSRQADQEYFFVKDPVTKKVFRFKKAEYFIARQLDGLTPPSDIRARFERELGVSLPTEKLEQFIERLRRFCLLDLALSEREITQRQRLVTMERSALRRALFIKVTTFNPDAFFDSISPRIRFFFTRPFVLTTIVLTIIAIVITAACWAPYKDQIAHLRHPDTILTLVLVILIVTILHEFAHGLTCKHYGGHVYEMGFLLIYLMPAFYCNVSDAWLFSEKRKRLWVSFAGIFFQTFIGAVAAIIWGIIDPDTWVSDVCCLTVAFSGISTLFDLNPLIKLDGYYLLSDCLDVPNLRKRAFDYIGSRIRVRISPGSGNSRVVTAKERRIYLLYGMLAGMYSVLLLFYILFKMAVYAITRFGERGLLVLIAVVLLVAMVSLERWTAKVDDVFKEGKRFRIERRKSGE